MQMRANNSERDMKFKVLRPWQENSFSNRGHSIDQDSEQLIQLPQPIGPSFLLKESGSKRSLPKMGDYQHNLKRMHSNHTRVGPGAYDVPSLFDNYNTNSFTISGLKKNPRINFDRKLY